MLNLSLNYFCSIIYFIPFFSISSLLNLSSQSLLNLFLLLWSLLCSLLCSLLWSLLRSLLRKPIVEPFVETYCGNLLWKPKLLLRSLFVQPFVDFSKHLFSTFRSIYFYGIFDATHTTAFISSAFECQLHTTHTIPFDTYHNRSTATHSTVLQPTEL